MPDFPAAVPALPPLPASSQDDILALFDRILPNHYLAPLKDPGPGYEYLQAVAMMIARVSTAVAHMGSGCYIGSSDGGTYAEVQIELTRPNSIFRAFTLLGRASAPQGTLVGTAEGYYYQLMTDVTFGATELGPKIVTARAIARGWMWNRPGPFTTADGEYIPGAINRLILPVYPLTPSPPNFDPTVVVRQVSAATGGSSPMLDAVGNDRGIERNFSGITTATLVRTDTANAVALLPNSVLATADGFHYATTERAAFAVGKDGPLQVSVRPLFLGEPSNDKPLSVIAAPIWEGGTSEPTMSVTSPTPVKESDLAYKARLTLLPSTVTPNAIKSLLNQILGNALSPYGLTYGYRETWDFRYQLAYDAPYSTGEPLMLDEANLNVPVTPFNAAVFVYDHIPLTPAGYPDGLANRYLAANPERGVIVVRLPNIPDIGGIYPGAAALVEQTKPAGATVLYVIGDT